MALEFLRGNSTLKIKYVCSALGLARSTFYATEKRKETNKGFFGLKDLEYDLIWKRIQKLWMVFPGLGYKKLALYLHIGKNKTLAILQAKRGKVAKKKKSLTQRRFPNLIKGILKQIHERKGNFEEYKKEYQVKDGKNGYRKLLVATRPFQIWQCDWKEIIVPCLGFKIYLFLIVDTYTRHIMGFSVTLIKDPESALKAVVMAIEKAKEMARKLKIEFNPEKLIVHSDQGSAYISNEYINYLEHTKVMISMADRGKPTQNPYAEAFISILSRFWLKHFEYMSFTEVDKSVKLFVRRYNNYWKHGGIDNLSPNEFLKRYKASHF